MSHYTVMVMTKDDDKDTVAAALAPFNENTEIAPYRDYEEGTPADFWAVSMLREKGLLTTGDLTWQQVRDAYIAHYGTDSSDVFIVDADDPAKAYSMSTYNPQSKWDWWTIGGRWPGRLTHVDGREVSQLRRGDMDLAVMRGAADLNFRARAVPGRAVAHTMRHSTWAQCVADYPGNVDAARSAYWGQPSVHAYKASLPADEARWAEAEFLDRIMAPDAEFERQVKIEVASAVVCHSTLDLGGRWIEAGEMGWFGMSSDNESDRIGYYEVMNGIIENLPDDTVLTVVDCHI